MVVGVEDLTALIFATSVASVVGSKFVCCHLPACTSVTKFDDVCVVLHCQYAPLCFTLTPAVYDVDVAHVVTTLTDGETKVIAVLILSNAILVFTCGDGFVFLLVLVSSA